MSPSRHSFSGPEQMESFQPDLIQRNSRKGLWLQLKWHWKQKPQPPPEGTTPSYGIPLIQWHDRRSEAQRAQVGARQGDSLKLKACFPGVEKRELDFERWTRGSQVDRMEGVGEHSRQGPAWPVPWKYSHEAAKTKHKMVILCHLHVSLSPIKWSPRSI